jgi:hypothetical protein
MNVPGFNLLGLALTMIGSQPVQYQRCTGPAVPNEAGFMAAPYAPAVPVNVGSVQAIPRARYSQLGLDLSKDYVTWFVPRAVFGVDRDESGDRFTWRGKLWQVESCTDWSAQDGWAQALAARIGEAP